MVFYRILRQFLNFCFCATSSRELFVCAIFYAFSNNDSKLPVMFQTIDAVIKRSNFRLKKLGEILKNVLIQIDILNSNRINQQNTFNWTIWCVFTSFPNFFLSYKSLPSCVERCGARYSQQVWRGWSTESPKSKGWKRWCHELWTRLWREPFVYIPSGT